MSDQGGDAQAQDCSKTVAGVADNLGVVREMPFKSVKVVQLQRRGMNLLNMLQLGLNLIGVVSTFVFCSYLWTLPQQYEPYIKGQMLAAVVALSAGPFIVNYWLLLQKPLPKQTFVSLFLLVLLVAVNAFILMFLYSDQFESSRGFALIACVGIYAVFFTFWAIFLVVFTDIKKFISNKPPSLNKPH